MTPVGKFVMQDETVVLLHGLWMTGVEFALMRYRLRRRHGFVTRRFSYRSVLNQIRCNSDSLARFISTLDRSTVHLVGHSLGGLVILRMLEQYPSQPRGRIVLLGAPVTGSEAARSAVRLPLGTFFLGRGQADGLLDGLRPDGASQREIGVIAGTLPAGLGSLISNVARPHDGTVAVAETRFPGIQDHLQMRVSHSTMIFSPGVADQVAEFLKNGRFRRDSTSGTTNC